LSTRRSTISTRSWPTSTPSFQVHVVDADVDGVEYMASVLEGMSDVSAVHIISHGAEGQFQLGSALVDQNSIESTYADTLSGISDALAENADLLIYGCDFAAGETGAAAAEALAAATGADVAASTDATGHALRGGDWELEYSTGRIETSGVATASLQEGWHGLLGNFSRSTGRSCHCLERRAIRPAPTPDQHHRSDGRRDHSPWRKS
jgi:hypothetical protein